MYTIEYEIKDTELVLGSGDGQTVFARTEDNYAVDLLKEAETMKEELTPGGGSDRMVRGIRWKRISSSVWFG